jgi:hypothetical protein
LAKRPRTIDEYLSGLQADQRVALQKLRVAVHAAAPRAEECIAWGMPGFRMDGTCFLTFRATAKHCSLHDEQPHGGGPQRGSCGLRHEPWHDQVPAGEATSGQPRSQAGQDKAG